MWIKHNHALYNTDDISKIEAKRTKLYATFKNGDVVVIGEFRATKECQDILSTISNRLLFENYENPGLIIKDTKANK